MVPELRPVDKNNRDEVASIVALVSKNYPGTAWPFTAESVMDPQKIFFKAYVNGEFIGMTGIAFKTPTLAETIKTIVLQEFRGKNYGKSLSLVVEEECRKRGVKKVMTTIYADNHSMIAIKLAQSYTIEGYHPDHEAPGFHEYSLGKILR